MKRELGIARCGLACCLCSENDKCAGCNSGDCPDKTGAKTENVRFQKTSVIAMNVMKTVKKDF